MEGTLLSFCQLGTRRVFATESYFWCFAELRNKAGDSSGDSKPIVMVISPLIALMKDQVDFFTSKGLKAVKALLGKCVKI